MKKTRRFTHRQRAADNLVYDLDRMRQEAEHNHVSYARNLAQMSPIESHPLRRATRIARAYNIAKAEFLRRAITAIKKAR